MSDVPTPGPARRMPRHVVVLLLVLVAVLGFALGGSLRTAPSSAGAQAYREHARRLLAGARAAGTGSGNGAVASGPL